MLSTLIKTGKSKNRIYTRGNSFVIKIWKTVKFDRIEITKQNERTYQVVKIYFQDHKRLICMSMKYFYCMEKL